MTQIPSTVLPDLIAEVTYQLDRIVDRVRAAAHPILLALAVTAVGIGLSACAVTPGVDEDSFTKAKADEILGVVEGAENRAARFALIGAAYSELAVERALIDPSAAPSIAGQLLRVEQAVNAFAVGDDALFPETDLRRITLDLAEVVADVAIDRVASLASNFVGGVNVAGLRDRARILAVQVALTDSLIVDLKARVADLNEGRMTAEQVTAAAKARFDANQAKVQALF